MCRCVIGPKTRYRIQLPGLPHPTSARYDTERINLASAPGGPHGPASAYAEEMAVPLTRGTVEANIANGERRTASGFRASIGGHDKYRRYTP